MKREDVLTGAPPALRICGKRRSAKRGTGVSTPAVLALEDGTVFRGVSVGAKGNTTGEVVFNTAMTGYQEILTDPSYCRQIVTLTYPHIGNTGTTPEDLESGAVYAAGLVIRDLPLLHSNWRATESLQSFLLRCKVVAIADIDTRKLTRLLRDKGAQSGCIMTGENIDQNAAVRAAKKFPGLKGMDLAKAVSTKKIYQWNDGLIWKTAAKPPRPQSRLHVVAYDYAMQAISKFLETDIPVFGICLGHQLLGLASGAKTVKMKFGHHGANHPVLEIDSGRVLISSQNHGFAVDEATLPARLRPTHRSLFDGSLQGVSRTDRPAFSFQGHPEASPGPHDLRLLFEHFMYLMVKRVQANSRGRTPVKQTSAEG